ncbi:MAG: NAD(P)-dependent oxidoreductase [Brevinema sp.]
MKIVSYGVRPVEEAFFHSLNTFGYELVLIRELLTDDNVDLCEGADVVMLRGNCKAHRQNLTAMKKMGVQYLLTRTVGYDHIDLQAIKDLGFKLCARVPAYSPTAISELAVSLALGLSRKSFAMISHSSQKNYIAYDEYFAKEIRHSTVAIIGAGRIGICSAKAFLGMGAKVLAYDPFPSEEAKNLLTLTSLEQIQQEADIILLHSPYFKDSNHHLINREFLSKVKDGAILVNTARGELIDTEALLEAVESHKLSGVALDVISGESAYFFKDNSNQILPDPIVEKLASYYPRVIITPHLASFTDQALTNMIEISYQNLNEFLTTNSCKNNLI